VPGDPRQREGDLTRRILTAAGWVPSRLPIIRLELGKNGGMAP